MKQNLREILENKCRDTTDDSLDNLISKVIISELNLGVKPNINIIAEKAFTNKSSISRFAKKNGFEGYKQFVEILWIEESNYYKKDSIDNVKNNSEEYLLNILDDLKIIQKDIILFAKLLNKSNDIFIFNSYQNEDVAEIFSSNLQSIGKKVIFVKNTFKQELSSFVKKDSLIIYLVSGTDNWTMQKIYNNVSLISKNIVVIGTKSQTIKFDSPKLQFEIDTPKIAFREIYKKIWFICFISHTLNLLSKLDEKYEQILLNPKFKY